MSVVSSHGETIVGSLRTGELVPVRGTRRAHVAHWAGEVCVVSSLSWAPVPSRTSQARPHAFYVGIGSIVTHQGVDASNATWAVVSNWADATVAKNSEFTNK